jgi:hypothetical protein
MDYLVRGSELKRRLQLALKPLESGVLSRDGDLG